MSSQEIMLESAITRWKDNAKATRLDDVKIGWMGCSFCEAYYGGSYCDRACPIVKKTSQHRCKGTPYGDVEKAVRDYDLPEAKRHSQRMVEFLESLRVPK